jgi:hypothetical protein
VLVLLAGGGYAAFLGLSGGSSKPVAAPLPLCRGPAGPAKPAVTVPRERQVAVLNATLRTGLAAQVAAQLKHRGFHVTTVGNTPTMMRRGVATVRYATAQRTTALYLAAQVPGSTLVAGGRGVQLDIGPGFRQLATARDANIAYARSLPSPSPTPTPTATPTTSPTCRPVIGLVPSSG